MSQVLSLEQICTLQTKDLRLACNHSKGEIKIIEIFNICIGKPSKCLIEVLNFSTKKTHEEVALKSIDKEAPNCCWPSI